MIVEAIDPNVPYDRWPIAVKPSRRCAACQCYLNSYTSDATCAPCRQAAEDRRMTPVGDLTQGQVEALRQQRNAAQRLRSQVVAKKKRAALGAELRAETKPDGVNYLNVTQVAWCLGVSIGEVVAMWRRGEIKGASHGRGSKLVVAMSELERWQAGVSNDQG